MCEYISISENRLHHILGVARECYSIAKTKGYDENFCKRMFMIGWIHDVGYEFSKSQSEHPTVSEELLKLINVTNNTKESSKVLHSIGKHGLYTKTKSAEWVILNMADMTIDSKGNKVGVMQRFEDIKNNYGEFSNQYLTACDICIQIGLIDKNTIVREM